MFLQWQCNHENKKKKKKRKKIRKNKSYPGHNDPLNVLKDILPGFWFVGCFCRHQLTQVSWFHTWKDIPIPQSFIIINYIIYHRSTKVPKSLTVHFQNDGLMKKIPKIKKECYG